jgi:hypothetical protein
MTDHSVSGSAGLRDNKNIEFMVARNIHTHDKNGINEELDPDFNIWSRFYM